VGLGDAIYLHLSGMSVECLTRHRKNRRRGVVCACMVIRITQKYGRCGRIHVPHVVMKGCVRYYISELTKTCEVV
jgi:ribosomal protein L32